LFTHAGAILGYLAEHGPGGEKSNESSLSPGLWGRFLAFRRVF